MKKILLLSDTHSYIDSRILSYAKNCDEVWHAGSESVLKAIRIAKAVSKKDLIVSVSGSWHGSIDQFLFSADKNLSPIANSSGLSNFYKKNLKIIPYNDIEKSKIILNKIKKKYLQ